LRNTEQDGGTQNIIPIIPIYRSMPTDLPSLSMMYVVQTGRKILTRYIENLYSFRKSNS